MVVLLPVSDKDIGTRLKAHLSAATAGDRDMMLKQIDALRQARLEAEHLRQECHQLKNELSSQVGYTCLHDCWLSIRSHLISISA